MFGGLTPPIGGDRTPGPLAPELYAALVRSAGRVRISRAGEAAEIVARPEGGFRAESWGELYHFDCPRCGDDRERGWVSHAFGQPRPGGRRPWFRGIGCWNEDCFADPAVRAGFFWELALPGGWTLAPPVLRGFTAAERRSVAAVKLPDQSVSLAIPAALPARRFLERRGFDWVDLADRYGLAYCLRAEEAWWRATGRLIVPVVVGGRLVGWQARSLDSEAKVKYWTMPGMRTSAAVYGIDALAASPIVVVCEGVADAWSLGPGGVALFGKTMSQAQRDLIRAAAPPGAWAVVLLDPGAERESARAAAALAEAFPGRTVETSVPLDLTDAAFRGRTGDRAKADVGALTTVAAWSVVARASEDPDFAAAVAIARSG